MRTIKFEKMLTDLKKTIDRKEIDLLPPYVFSGEVKVIEEARQVGEAADFLSRHACLGFDTETRPAFRKGEIYKVSLLQLAVPDQVFLFRLNKCGFQPALVRLLASPRIIKIGVGIRDDNTFFRRFVETVRQYRAAVIRVVALRYRHGFMYVPERGILAIFRAQKLFR